MTSLSTFLRLLLLLLYTSEIFPQPHLTGCLDRCGNVTIPYPFGLAKGCYLSQQFLVHCNVSDSGSPTPYFWGWPITKFVPEASEFHVLESVTRACHNETRRSPMVKTELQFPPHFTISHTRNSFYGVGCGAHANLLDPRFFDQSSGPWGCSWTGVCISKCDDNSADFLSRKNTTTCYGFGCCRSSIPEGAGNMSLYLMMERNDTKWYSSRYLCSYAFIAENDCFTISPNSSLGLLGGRNRLPMVVNWEMTDGPCTAKSVACGAFTQCIETDRHGKAYICRCLQGYNGNPYHPDGCRDIDECKRNPCTVGTCINTQGSYHCSPTNHSTSTLKGWVIGLSGATALLLLFFIPVVLRLRRRTGGRTLAEQDQTGRIYSLKEIMDATDSLDEANIIGQGGFGIVLLKFRVLY